MEEIIVGISLFDNEWNYLLQIVNRIYSCESYENVCKTIAYQIYTLIPYKQNVFFKIERENGLPVIKEPLSYNVSGGISDSTRFLEGDYPRWSEYIMSPKSTVFRQSDLIPADKWEKSRVYRDIWQPQGNYWGLFLSIVSNDQPLMLLLLTRSKKDTDFTNKDVRILNLLSVTLEQKLETLKTSFQYRSSASLDARLASFSLTKRESEIVRLLCQNMNTEEVCEEMVISSSTFHKHLSNIYAKTGFKNRIQLFNYFNGYSE